MSTATAPPAMATPATVAAPRRAEESHSDASHEGLLHHSRTDSPFTDGEHGNSKKRPFQDEAADAATGTAGTANNKNDKSHLTEKKLRRLEKNRLSARECRRRKREATEDLERQINVLDAENLRLRLQLQIGDEAEESRLREQTKVTADIDDLLKSGASEADIHATLEEFKEKYADYGKDRRSAVEFHLRNIQRLLKPTQTTSLVMRVIEGSSVGQQQQQQQQQTAGGTTESTTTTTAAAATMPPEALTTKKDPKALFRFLVDYLEVTPKQAALLKDSRFVAQEMDGCLESAMTVLGELSTRMTKTGEDLESEFANIRSILTPTQAAKFLVWVANNHACIHMLNELWNRVYPGSSGEPTAGEEAETNRNPLQQHEPNDSLV